MRDVLPTRVFDEIANHLRYAAARGEEGWESSEEDDDTITGDFCSKLRTRWHRTTGERDWHWRVSYKRFRGRGSGAEEKYIGADGIFQVDVRNEKTGEIVNKGLLFQAKKVNDRNRQRFGSEPLDERDGVRRFEHSGD